MIVDCSLFAGERDMLALRMMTLAPVVDHFVVVACARTHQGQPVDRAPIQTVFMAAAGDAAQHSAVRLNRVGLYWFVPSNILDRGQGVHMERAADERGPAGSAFFQHIEKQHRDGMRDAVQRLGAVGNDVMLMSDVDEIPTVDAVRTAANMLARESLWLVFAQRFHSTALNYLHPQQPWWGTCAARYGAMQPQAHRDARTTIGSARQTVVVVDRGGWHFSWFGTDADRQTKLDTFSHAELRGKFDPADGRRAGYHANGELLVHLSDAECETLDWPDPLIDGRFNMPPVWAAPAPA